MDELLKEGTYITLLVSHSVVAVGLKVQSSICSWQIHSNSVLVGLMDELLKEGGPLLCVTQVCLLWV